MKKQPTDLEIDEIVNNLKNNVEDVEFFMQNAYEDALFLGTTIKSNIEAFDTILFMIRLCISYFKKYEDYEKLYELKKLLELINLEKKNIVCEKLIDEIIIYTN
jgi:hypothetical protein